MSCQVCDHTVHKVGVMLAPYNDVPLFWCPRCGTLRANVVTEQDEPPQLVKRIRNLLDASEPKDRNISIEECCLLPKDRTSAS